MFKRFGFRLRLAGLMQPQELAGPILCAGSISQSASAPMLGS